jgi:beta-galactosidase
MFFTAPVGARNFRWLGLGPFDAYPNENVAPILGVWTGTLGASDTAGVKAMRWAELNGAGKRFRVVGTGYLRTLADDPHTLQILSSVAGRASKGRRPELPSEQMNATNGNSFVGEFTIVPTIRQP